MQYTKFNHVINACFLIILFALPISECFINERIPHEIGLSIINLTSLVVILMFLDFYKIKLSNDYKGVGFYLSLGLITIILSLALAKINGLTLSSDMFFGANFQTWNSAWIGSAKAQILYMLGLALSLTSIGLSLRLSLFNNINKPATKSLA